MNKYMAFLVLSVVVSSFSQMLLKTATKKQHGNVIQEYVNPWVIGGYVLMVLSTLFVIYAYRGIDYKNGPVIESLGYILVMILGKISFDEKITRQKIVGNFIVLVGIFVFYL